MAHVVLVRLSGQGGQLRDEAVDGALDVDVGAVRVLAFGIERAQARNHGAQHAHRVRILRKRLKEALHVLVHQRVVADARFEVGKLLRVRQFAVDQEVGHFEERGVVRELFDAVAAVAQHAIFTVEVSDGTLRGPGVLVPQIQRDVARRGPQF